MGRIPEEIIEKIKEENDIVDVISEKMQLKKSGSNYMGLCPFHGEKSPSFSVNRNKQIYKCFGCGAGGNVFSFLMASENITFIDAVKKLATRANIAIPEDNVEYKAINNKKETIENMNREAGKFFYQNLKANKIALDYFLKRNISMETITKFGLGYSLDSWDALIKHLKSKGYKDYDINESGLVRTSDKGKVYDMFRNRLMFPVFDYRGRVIGFGGRVFDNSKPKYINTPETFLFKKGTNLYGLNFALGKNNVIEDKTIIICEGYMDCIAMHQAGVTNSVATLGTALTPYHGKLLKRYADKIIVSFDADEAGMMATLRGLDILTKEGLEIFILKVPDGKDPDEFIKTHGRDEFKKLISTALPLVRFKLNYAKSNLNLKLDGDRLKYFKNIKDIFKDMDPISKDLYVGVVSDDINVSKEAIYEAINKNYDDEKNTNNVNTNKEDRKEVIYTQYQNNMDSNSNGYNNSNSNGNVNQHYNNQGRQESYNQNSSQNYNNPEQYSNGYQNNDYGNKRRPANNVNYKYRNSNFNFKKDGSNENNDPMAKTIAFIESGQIKSQRIVLRLLSEGYKPQDDLNVDYFATDVHKKIFKMITEYNSTESSLSTYMLSNLEDRNSQSEWAQIEALDDIPENIEKDIIINDYYNSLKIYNKKRRKDYLTKKLALIEKEGNFEESLEIAKELLELNQLLGEN